MKEILVMKKQKQFKNIWNIFNQNEKKETDLWHVKELMAHLTKQ